MLNIKNYVKSILAIIMLITLVSCVSTKKEKDPDFLGDYNDQKLGTLSANTVTRIKKELKPTEVELIFAPRSNKVGLSYRFMADNILVVLTKENRDVLIDAMEKYLLDYENGLLTEKNNNKKAYFGKTKVFMTWGLIAVSREATPPLRCEYELLSDKNRPYFILATATQTSLDGEVNSPAIRLALTPNQCRDFIQVLNQKTLNAVVAELDKEYKSFDDKFDTPANTESNEETPVEDPDGF